MEQLERVLVVNDTTDGIENAIEKAAVIEHYTGAEVEVAEVIWDHIEEEPIGEADKANLIAAFVAAERHKLRAIMAPWEDRIAWKEERVIWHKRAEQAIAEEVQNRSIDLVIKPIGRHHGLADFLVTPLDWKILRTVDCPVLISKPEPWAKGHCVLAAINTADEAHRDLTAAVLSAAGRLCAVLDSELHVVTAYPRIEHAEDYYEAASDYELIKTELEETRKRTLETLVGDSGISVAAVHSSSGDPADVIGQWADELQPTLTVIGTSARSGLGKLVLGNTAEDVLNRLRGDLLTVRAPD